MIPSQRQPPAITACLLSALLVGAVACKAKVGDPCTQGQAACLDQKTELACQGGNFIAAPCKGSKGCVVQGEEQRCDYSGNAVGDVCSTDDEGKAECTAEGERISCTNGKYVVEPCRGPDGCKVAGDRVDCDKLLSRKDDPCRKIEEKSYACSDDRKHLLVCKDGKFVVVEECSGDHACKVRGNSAGCLK